jgi:hypothetical protein
MITVYLGDIFECLAKLACGVDSTAKLITSDNYKNLSPGIYYTCLGDVGGLSNLGEVLRNADEIIYAPPLNGKWSDEKHGVSQMKQWTEDYLRIFRFRTVVKNFLVPDPTDKLEMLRLVDTRKTNDSQLWIAGCSISHGTGVQEHERYGQLLSTDLNIPVSFLTRGASSVIWAADQILRSNIQPNDLVVWGITSMPRVPFFNNKKLTDITVTSYDQNPGLDGKFSFDYFTSEDVTYRTVSSLFQVINYCKKIRANLLLVSLLNDGTLLEYVKEDTNLLQLSFIWGRDFKDRWIDLGSDHVHPGPKTHKFYSIEIMNKIKQLEWI